MNAKELLEFSDFHQGYVSHYVQLADTKATAVFGASSAVTAFLVSKSWFSKALLTFWPVPSLAAWAALIFLVASALLSFGVIIPRRNRSGPGPIFFMSVAEYDEAAAYLADLRSKSDAEYAQCRVQHCYDLAIVCARKYRMLRYAMWTAVFGIMLAGTNIYLHPS